MDGSQDITTTDSIFVGKLSRDVTEEELRAAFQDCGAIKRMTIVSNKPSGRPRGFAYMQFEEDAGADAALQLDGTDLKGKQIKVERKVLKRRVRQRTEGPAAETPAAPAEETEETLAE